MGQLATIRVEADETITEFVLRLQVLFDDLENFPGDSNYMFNDVNSWVICFKLSVMSLSLPTSINLSSLRLPEEPLLLKRRVTI